ncbi:malate dehydrogenase-like [Leptopilina boulardi]|uniref:malate dehydrogenase-like n=1 Tax=Leptopilina boulardi TaxID=63433 RepID=UPI0021F61EBB|nr:malate dehydrogenase-like [Leptopilina boulardi]
MDLQRNDFSNWLKQIKDFNDSFRRNSIPRIVITDASSSVTRSLIYRLIYDEVFGINQEVIINLYESSDKSTFLNSLIIEITACAPHNLKEISVSHDVSKVFKNADVIFSIGRARGYDFSKKEIISHDPFFEETVRTAKIHAEAIDRFAKKDVKVITIGNTEASIIHKYAKSIPVENITSLALIFSRIAAAQVCLKLQRPCDEIKNIIPWGFVGSRFYPDFKFATFKDGTPVMAETKKAWLKNELPQIIRQAIRDSRYTNGVSYALADHCKNLLRGTFNEEWTVMGVFSDGSYGVPAGMFFTFPVQCKNGTYEIVKDLPIDEFYIKRQIKHLAELIHIEVKAAFSICHEIPNLVTSC